MLWYLFIGIRPYNYFKSSGRLSWEIGKKVISPASLRTGLDGHDGVCQKVWGAKRIQELMCDHGRQTLDCSVGSCWLVSCHFCGSAGKYVVVEWELLFVSKVSNGKLRRIWAEERKCELRPSGSSATAYHHIWCWKPETDDHGFIYIFQISQELLFWPTLTWEHTREWLQEIKFSFQVDISKIQHTAQFAYILTRFPIMYLKWYLRQYLKQYHCNE